jgi:hypothetical protein
MMVNEWLRKLRAGAFRGHGCGFALLELNAAAAIAAACEQPREILPMPSISG